MSQMDLLPRPQITRASAREQAMKAAQARADVAITAVGDKADRLHANWCEMAVNHLRAFARSQGGVWTIEMARAVLDGDRVYGIADACLKPLPGDEEPESISSSLPADKGKTVEVSHG